MTATHCSCGARFRTKDTTVDELPTTVPKAARGLCWTCYYRELHRAAAAKKPSPAAVGSYPTCTSCDRPMRAKRAITAHHPGTIQIGSNGLCITCYVHDRNPAVSGVPAARPDQVEDADWLTRPDNYTDVPDRVAERLGFSGAAHLQVALRRAGRPDLADRLVTRGVAA